VISTVIFHLHFLENHSTNIRLLLENIDTHTMYTWSRPCLRVSILHPLYRETSSSWQYIYDSPWGTDCCSLFGFRSHSVFGISMFYYSRFGLSRFFIICELNLDHYSGFMHEFLPSAIPEKFLTIVVALNIL